MSILVVMESRGAGWHPTSVEALAAGQRLGQDLGLPVRAVVAGANVSALAADLATRKLDRIFTLDHPLLGAYTPDGYTAAFQQMLQAEPQSIVLFPHTYQVRDWAPKLATRFNSLLISDVVGYQADAGRLVLTRQFFQGRLMADVRALADGPVFVSVQAGAFRPDSAEPPAGTAAIQDVAVTLDAALIRSRPEEPFRETDRAVDLSAASLIVSVGRGIQEKENLGIIEELAQALGAEIAASRPICDNGWLPMERQVGSSGQTVAPKVYFAIGISGAIQHLVGMKGSKTIVAINKDPEAPIFEVADYGIVGDLFEIVPALTAAIKQGKA